jgi:RNA polymerase sigma factor (sigma-70 family)
MRTAVEKELIIRAVRGDTRAFEEIVRLTQDAVYNLALRMCNDRDEAFDLSQEIFLRLHSRLEYFDTGREFMPWALKVAANVCLNSRKKKRLKTVSFQAMQDAAGEGRAFEPAAAEATSDDALPPDTAAGVRAAIAALPEDYGIVVSLRYVEDMPYEKIAEVLDLPLGTVKNRLFRARDMLRRMLPQEVRRM